MNRWHSVANSFSLFVFVSDVLSIFVDLLVFTNFFCSVLSCQSPKNHKSLICDRNSKVLLSCDASLERSAIDLVVHKSIVTKSRVKLFLEHIALKTAWA